MKVVRHTLPSFALGFSSLTSLLPKKSERLNLKNISRPVRDAHPSSGIFSSAVEQWFSGENLPNCVGLKRTKISSKRTLRASL
jgi:hypothetical protein